MKIRKYIVYILCFVLCLFNVLISFSNKYIKVNDNIDLGGYLISHNYDYNDKYADDSFLNDYPKQVVSKDLIYEKQIISFAKLATDSLFATNKGARDYLSMYYIRKPYNVFDTYSLSSIDFGESYNYNYGYIYELKNKINSSDIHYSGIKNVKLYYLFGGNYVVSVYLNDFYYNDILLDNMVVEYQVDFEKSSNKLKMSDLLYFDLDDADNVLNSTSANKEYSTIPITQDDIDSSDVALDFMKYMVSIEAYDDGKLVDKVNGFFISKDVIATTYDVFEGDYNYVIKSGSNSYTFNKMISFSKMYNLCLIKIKELTTLFASNSNSIFMTIGEKLIVPNYDNYYYVGTSFKSLDLDSYIIRTNIRLNKNDRGTPLIDTSGSFIGINSLIDDDYNFSYSVKSSLLYDLLLNNYSLSD